MGYILFGICGYVIYRFFSKPEDSVECKPHLTKGDTAKDELSGDEFEAYFFLEEFIDRPTGSQNSDFRTHVEDIVELGDLEDPDLFDCEDDFMR